MDNTDKIKTKEPWELSYEEFTKVYKVLLVNVAKKQKKGGLDSEDRITRILQCQNLNY